MILIRHGMDFQGNTAPAQPGAEPCKGIANRDEVYPQQMKKETRLGSFSDRWRAQ
jgi:hypothetical protein